MNSINSISLLQQMREMSAVAQGSNINTQEIKNTGFSEFLKNSIDTVNDLQKSSSALKTGYELGDANITLTEVMIASQKSEISFQMLMQVRNKFLNAYQEIMRIQI